LGSVKIDDEESRTPSEIFMLRSDSSLPSLITRLKTKIRATKDNSDRSFKTRTSKRKYIENEITSFREGRKARLCYQY